MTEELDQNQCIQWAKFFQEGQRRNFAYLFPVADDAVQIDVTTLNLLSEMFGYQKCFFFS